MSSNTVFQLSPAVCSPVDPASPGQGLCIPGASIGLVAQKRLSDGQRGLIPCCGGVEGTHTAWWCGGPVSGMPEE